MTVGPFSWYSLCVIHTDWNVLIEVAMPPPSQVKNCLSLDEKTFGFW
jgi:hypothetical protein